MIVLFCGDPFNAKMVETDYQREYDAVMQVGLQASLLNFEELVGGNLQRAIVRVQDQPSETPALYRGWMLTPTQYADLYRILLSKGVRLITSLAQYRHCHWLPESYPVICRMTPETVWMPKENGDLVEQAVTGLAHFGSKPVIIKDYVKSQKHAWHEACYIPNAADAANAVRIIRRFLELQNKDLQGGIVLREYVPLSVLTKHSQSGMPLAREYRLFFLSGKLMQIFRYWEEGDYGDELPDVSPFLTIAKNVQSPFFTMDLAQREDGCWIIIELGDGQVAGLPDHADAVGFYRALYELSNKS